MRRALIITIVALIIIGLGVAAYFIFFRSTPSVTVTMPSGDTNLPSAGQTSSPSSGGSGSPSFAPSASPVAVTARLVEISTGPVVPGEAVVDQSAATTRSSPNVAVNYIDQQSGNVYSYLTNDKTITRTSNKTIPGIESASWLPNGSLAFVRYLSGADFSTINTYALSASSSDGFFLPQDLADIAVSPTSVLALASGVNGSVASLEHIDGTHATTVFTTPLSALRVSFAGKNQYLAFTKPTATLPGDAFLVSGTGRFSHIAGPLNGLVALASPSGKWLLVSYTLNAAMQMELINTTTGQELPLPVATIADKCVWTEDESALYCGIPTNSTAATYPDDWYQGTLSFSDRIWKIDVAGRYAQLVLDFSSANSGSLDVESLAVDPAMTILTFINKNDGSLWSYSL
ncbi:MAG TPA: hypothetical protein VNF51_02565 [Candidatus Paceibacterota bacterium]|nr:hypothetical protein [Candidatus Paceibacterota bacterium]